MYNYHSGHSPNPPRPYADVGGGGFWSNMSHPNQNFYENLPVSFGQEEFLEDDHFPGFEEEITSFEDFGGTESMGYDFETLGGNYEEDYFEESESSGNGSCCSSCENGGTCDEETTFPVSGYSPFSNESNNFGTPSDWMNPIYYTNNPQPPPFWALPPNLPTAPQTTSPSGPSMVENLLTETALSNNNPASSLSSSSPTDSEGVSPFFQAPNPTPNPTNNQGGGTSSQIQGAGGPVLNTSSSFTVPTFSEIPLSQMGASYNKN